MTLRWSVYMAEALVAGFAMAGFASALGEKKTEVEGSWKLAKGGKGAPTKLTFSGNNFILTFDEKREYKGTFKLNMDENPSWMDMTFVSGPDDEFKGKTALCIYAFDAETFKWCATKPGGKRRPQQFAETMGDVRLFLGNYEKDKK